MAYNGPLPQVVKAGGTGAATLTGVLTGNGTSAVTANAVTQYGTVVAGASNAVSSIAPSATSGIPYISQGSSANPAFGTAEVAGGGTGATTFTANGVLYGNTTSAIQVTAAGTTGQFLGANTGSAPTWQTPSAGASTYFSAYLSTTATDVTGDGTAYTIIFDSTYSNTGTVYNTSTGVFTAPATGIYCFNIVLGLGGLAAGFTAGFVLFLCNNNYSSAKTSQVYAGNMANYREADSNQISMSQSLIVNLTSADTMQVVVIINNSTKTVDVLGATSMSTSFSGFRIA